MSNQFKKIPSRVYHGTTSNHIESLNKGIDVNVVGGNKRPDFGRGFYTTTSPKQAGKQAIRKAEAHNNKRPDIFKVEPVIVTFEVNFEELQSLTSLKPNEPTSLIFDDPDKSWGEFVLNNRKFNPNLNLPHNIDQKYHFVFGPLADGKNGIGALINDLEENLINFDQFLSKIQPRKQGKLYQDQLSIHTFEAAKLLTFKGVN